MNLFGHGLGFGCSHVTGGFETRSNIRLLRSAYDLGLRYFDTAPLYGHGTSEQVVGQAFREDRHRIVIATKVGIPHPTLTRRKQIVRYLAHPLRRWFPAVSKKAVSQIYRSGPATDFSWPSMQKSIEKSLRNLRTDYIDLLLLHEVRASDLSDEMKKGLDEVVAQGKVRRLGLGTGVPEIREIQESGHQFEVYQRPWSIFVPDEDAFAHKYQIFHGAIGRSIDAIATRLREDPALCMSVQEVSGMRCNSVEDVAKILLSTSLAANASGMTLFSSRRSARVESYIRFVQEYDSDRLGRKLVQLFRSQDTTTKASSNRSCFQ
ncbi:aldo/keto reductase [Bradyrhizobium sp. USDA 3397]